MGNLLLFVLFATRFRKFVACSGNSFPARLEAADARQKCERRAISGAPHDLIA
jgi:hypothetical protein